jgi:hypothetical protein
VGLVLSEAAAADQIKAITAVLVAMDFFMALAVLVE